MSSAGAPHRSAAMGVRGRPRQLADRSCMACARWFRPSRATRRFCSPECAQGSRRQRLDAATCVFCSRVFRPARVGQRFCSRRCAGKVTSASRPRRPSSLPTRACGFCGRPFQPRHRGHMRFCSRQCAFAYRTVHAERKRLDQRAAKAARTCKACGVSFIDPMLRANFCSESCRRLWARCDSRDRSAAKKPIVQRKCRECGQAFTPEYGEKRRCYCSPKCGGARKRRVEKAVRRARLRQLPREPIDPLVVFEREGWICGICGVMTRPNLRGTTHQLSPELDHIIPLAAGGAHVVANVQTAHRACNLNKGVRPFARTNGMLGLLT